jgi:hypothetical protein
MPPSAGTILERSKMPDVYEDFDDKTGTGLHNTETTNSRCIKA